MTAAEGVGATRAREYLKRQSQEMLATMTLEEFCAIGRLDAKQRFKLQASRDAFVLGWFQVGQEFCTLFKPDDNEQFVAEKEVERIEGLLKEVERRLGKLVAWRNDDVRLATYLDHTIGSFEETQVHFQVYRGYMKTKDER